jgi:hypothetical protein
VSTKTVVVSTTVMYVSIDESKYDTVMVSTTDVKVGSYEAGTE